MFGITLKLTLKLVISQQLTLLIYLIAGTVLGLATIRTGIVAAPLAGALLEAGLPA